MAPSLRPPRVARVTGEYDAVAGGLLGFDESSLTGLAVSVAASYATGNVTTITGTVGGFVGGIDAGAIDASYATGNVTASGASGGVPIAGGFAGLNIGTIATAYALGDVSGGVGSYIGGFIGGQRRHDPAGLFHRRGHQFRPARGIRRLRRRKRTHDYELLFRHHDQRLSSGHWFGHQCRRRRTYDGEDDELREYVRTDVRHDAGPPRLRDRRSGRHLQQRGAARPAAHCPCFLAEATASTNIHVLTNAHQLQLVGLDPAGTYFLAATSTRRRHQPARMCGKRQRDLCPSRARMGFAAISMGWADR